MSEFFWIAFVIGWGGIGFVGWLWGEFVLVSSFELKDLLAIPGAMMLGPFTWFAIYM